MLIHPIIQFTSGLAKIWKSDSISLGIIGTSEKFSGSILSFLYFSVTFEKIVQNNSRPVSTIARSSLGIHSMISLRELLHRSIPSKFKISLIINALFERNIEAHEIKNQQIKNILSFLSYNSLNDF